MKEEHSRHLHHQHHRYRLSYPVSLWQKFYTLVLSPLVLVGLFFLAIRIFGGQFLGNAPENLFVYISLALAATFVRLLIAYLCALAVALPLAFLIYFSPRAEQILLPVYDVIESIPVLAFFPLIIIFFLNFGLLNAAAIFIIFLGMVWNIVFSIVGGLASIPYDVKAAAQVFGLKGFQRFRLFLIPAIFPQIITGSLLAWAQGWNVVIVAEVLHTYIPGGTSAQDLFGVGSVLVNASASNQGQIFFFAIFFMIAAIAFINFFVWQKLLQYAERFKFD